MGYLERAMQRLLNRMLSFKQLWWLSMVIAVLINAASAQTLQQYRLAADDQISVSVFNEPDLSLESTRVAANGTISMPLIGQILVKGLTIDEVELKITKLYLGDYLKKPDISVAVVEYRQFYVNGEVDKPGGFSFREGMTVQRAVSLAGGFTERAARNKIKLIREDSPEREARVDLNTPIRPGDVITVEESFF
jgi:polysaccharide export outer membrane protein